jgi:FlaA1/EpsC-like NDP-sugar epimerase
MRLTPPEPVPIVDLVRKYTAAVNASDVQIRFTGLRPGEKWNEKVFSDSEERLPTSHPKIWATRARPIATDLTANLERLYAAAAANDDEATLAVLRAMLPDYQPAQHQQDPASAAAPYPDGF